MNDITVPVPEDRTAEFYQFFSLWLEGSLSLTGSQETAGREKRAVTPWGHTEQDYADAEVLWAKYSRPARAMFSLLIDNEGVEYSGDQIAKACDIPNGSRGVAGVLAWPARHGIPLGRSLPSRWRVDAETLQGFYWAPADRAELFRAARENVEGKS